MSLPRRVVSGTTYVVSRRCSERRMFLMPRPRANAILGYCLSAMSERHGIQLHAYCILSSHYHLVLTDPLGVLPAFMRDLNSLIARAFNTLLGRGDHFWDGDGYSSVELHDAETVIDQIAYVIANPTAAGLVSAPRRWPGLISVPSRLGQGRLRARRPAEAFFARRREPLGERKRRKPSRLPEEGCVALSVPPLLAELGAEDYRERVRARLAEKLEAVRRRRAASGAREFLGAARVTSRNWWQSAGDTFPDFGRDPRVAGGGTAKRHRGLLRELSEWRERYREALRAWREGHRDVVFPEGTYLMRVVHAATVAGRSPPRGVAA